MKTTIAFGLACIVCCGGLLAQSPDPSVVAAGGGTATGIQVQLEWTLGEAAIASTTASRVFLTEGFHQPSLEVEPVASAPFDPAEEPINAPTSGSDPSGTTFTAAIFPNPVTTELALHFDGTGRFEGAQAELLSLDGKVLLHKQLQPGEQQTTFHLAELPPGIYFLRSKPDGTQDNGIRVQTFKVTKF